MFTKYAKNGNTLLIFGDVLRNNVSLIQLYNLIQINYKTINTLIFKDNGKISPKGFSELMKYIFLISNLEEIAFLGSVMNISSFKELKYLVGIKKIKIFVLYKSYFLDEELADILNTDVNKINVDH